MNQETEHIVRNLYRFYTRVAELNGFERGTIAGSDYVWNRKGSWPGYVLGVAGADSIPDLVRAIENKLAPSFCLVENSMKRELQMLEESGIRRIREWKGMYLDSRHYTAGLATKENSHIQFMINDRSEPDHWLSLVNKELMSGTQIERSVVDNLIESDAFQFVVAYADGQPASCGLSFREGGICGLFMIATKAALRGKGFGSLVTARLIEHAISEGDRGIVLQATDMGAGLYSRLGFSDINRISVVWYLGK